MSQASRRLPMRSETRRLFLDALETTGSLTFRTAVEQSGLSLMTVRRTVGHLREQGFLRAIYGGNETGSTNGMGDERGGTHLIFSPVATAVYVLLQTDSATSSAILLNPTLTSLSVHVCSLHPPVTEAEIVAHLCREVIGHLAAGRTWMELPVAVALLHEHDENAEALGSIVEHFFGAPPVLLIREAEAVAVALRQERLPAEARSVLWISADERAPAVCLFSRQGARGGMQGTDWVPEPLGAALSQTWQRCCAGAGHAAFSDTLRHFCRTLGDYLTPDAVVLETSGRLCADPTVSALFPPTLPVIVRPLQNGTPSLCVRGMALRVRRIIWERRLDGVPLPPTLAVSYPHKSEAPLKHEGIRPLRSPFDITSDKAYKGL